MAQKYFVSKQKEESNRETVLTKCSNHPVPAKDSYGVIAEGARSQKCKLLGFLFCTSTVLNTARTRSMKSAPNSYDRL